MRRTQWAAFLTYPGEKFDPSPPLDSITIIYFHIYSLKRLLMQLRTQTIKKLSILSLKQVILALFAHFFEKYRTIYYYKLRVVIATILAILHNP